MNTKNTMNAHNAKKTFTTKDGTFNYYSINIFQDNDSVDITKMPYSIRVLLENVLRSADQGIATNSHVNLVAGWNPELSDKSEFPFMPGRVVLQDFTGVPVAVDLAAMRDAVTESGKDASIINPIVRSDMVIDHSVQVDHFSTSNALNLNIGKEFERNTERYELLKWAQDAFDNFNIIPPGTGIIHQVNLEYLAEVILKDDKTDDPTAYLDTCVGTDSHTTMINGLGVLGWGVGGIEAEAVMLGQPYYMVVPEVIGVKLTGQLPEGSTSTDLVLAIVETLRSIGVVEKFVEFYGPGLKDLPLADRATIANMAPEYGATCGFFPIDAQTIRYLQNTGRSNANVRLVEKYSKENSFFYDETTDPHYTKSISFNLSEVQPAMAGPKRPQDKVLLPDVPKNFEYSFGNTSTQGHKITIDDSEVEIKDSSVVIAAITSCTNTSNPSVMIGAGLLARNARAKGLNRKKWVKSSLAPGSTVVTRYLQSAGLDKDLDYLGFNTVGYGCTTCIGNSGPLPQPVANVVSEKDLTVAAVLSGNRNFEGRVHPQVKANYLASPMLVVAYAIAGTVNINLAEEPLGQSESGDDIYLKDIWPSQNDISEAMNLNLTSKMFEEQYNSATVGPKAWNELSATSGVNYQWDHESTYIQKPPYFEDFQQEPVDREEIVGSRVLVYLEDSVTTDHISPAGAIPPSAPAGRFLSGSDVPRNEYNSFGSRRGNHDVMARGTFANIRLRNKIAPDSEGDWTTHFPSGDLIRVYEAAERYKEDAVPLIIVAGKEYGTGSSRDWAAKGPMLLGVRAVLAESFERIHRSNLIGMGILPLVFLDGESAKSLGLTGKEIFDIPGASNSVDPGSILTITATSENGETIEFKALCRIDTDIENEYYKHRGLLPYVLRKMISD